MQMTYKNQYSNRNNPSSDDNIYIYIYISNTKFFYLLL